MTNQHPITPPPEMVRQWRREAPRCPDGGIAREDWLMDRAAQWGADQELEACCEWLSNEILCESNVHRYLRAARRPKPPSLKEQALQVLEDANLDSAHYNIILRALEQLND